ncbi:MAG: alpha-amylase family glycosyl hydrolase [Rhizonema sp. PD37]|nr:alpha-amylase family glycosyl hydrolase [Rhizonema sp. PD37]
MTADLLARKETSFVLWHVGNTTQVPSLIIGQVKLGAPITLIKEEHFLLQQVSGFPDLWEIPAAKCNLSDGEVYHYWFEVTVSHPDPKRAGERLRITDPTAYTVDWRLRPDVKSPFGNDDRYPPAVIKYSANKLVPADIGGEDISSFGSTTKLDTLPMNNQLVIYELPTTWSRSAEVGGGNMGVGTFLDVTALIDSDVEGANFVDFEITQKGRSYLTELGINALELLPPADSTYNRQWGYGTTNYFAPDFELGFPDLYSWPTPNRDLAKLIDTCHNNRIRFFVDTVMAFSKNNPYLAAACDDFFILYPCQAKSDPDAHNSRGQDDSNLRNAYGASLFRYAKMVQGYDPISGKVQTISPARQLMKLALTRWMTDFHIDGLRLDSIENVQNWDFIQQYKDLARQLNQQRFAAQGVSGADERFLVVGEELSEPKELLSQRRLDGLWHQSFKDYIRMALIGRNHENETGVDAFEQTVRKAIDCRQFGYNDLTQAIIYLTSHDVEGDRNERLFNFFDKNNIVDCEKRVKLAFACLLTAVGIPMILAGDEFADHHNLFDSRGQVTQDSGKQVDPVSFVRLDQDWRRRIKEYVSRLIKLRTSYSALAVNDIEFIHVDFNDNKRVLVWRRGQPNSDKQVVVIANFSDFGTPDPLNPSAEYVIHNWPVTPPGKHWREVSQDRDVLPAKVGREPIFPWEAKVYAI